MHVKSLFSFCYFFFFLHEMSVLPFLLGTMLHVLQGWSQMSPSLQTEWTVQSSGVPLWSVQPLRHLSKCAGAELAPPGKPCLIKTTQALEHRAGIQHRSLQLCRLQVQLFYAVSIIVFIAGCCCWKKATNRHVFLHPHWLHYDLHKVLCISVSLYPGTQHRA